MSEKDDGGPAFPEIYRPKDPSQVTPAYRPGMSLRAYFSGQALIGLAEGTDAEEIAKAAVKRADALIEELKK